MDATWGRVASGSALEAITIQNRIKSPFLRLPAEIRNQIYGYVLSNKGIKICHENECGDGIRHSKDDTPSYSYEDLAADNDDRIYAWAHNMHGHYSRSLLRLLRVSKQVYAEARLWVLSTNILKGELGDIITFLQEKILNPNQMSAVKVVQLEADHTSCTYHACVTGDLHVDTNYILQRLEKLEGLEKVILHLHCVNRRHQAHKTFGVLATEKMNKTHEWNGKMIEVGLMLEKRPGRHRHGSLFRLLD